MPSGLLLWRGSVRCLLLRGRSEHDRMAPAAPTQLPSPPPITDRIALGALTHTFPPELVDQVIEQTGRAEQRRRLLPARVVVYWVLALALYSHAAYEEVMRCLVEGLGWAQRARRGRRSWPRPASGWAPSRSRCCSPRPPGHWRPTRPGARGIATGGCWWWTGPALTCPTARATRRSVGPAAAGGRGWARSRRCGWWGWWRRARTRSWTPPRVRMRPGSRRWHASLPARVAGWGLGCCCWPTGCLPAPSCGRPWPPPARTWPGGSGAAAPPPRSCPSSRCWPTGRG